MKICEGVSKKMIFLDFSQNWGGGGCLPQKWHFFHQNQKFLKESDRACLKEDSYEFSSKSGQ